MKCTGSCTPACNCLGGIGNADLQRGIQVQWNGDVKRLSWEPRAFLLERFLSDAECDHLINLAGTKLEKSQVVDPVTGGSMKSKVRTSSSMFLSMNHDAVVAAVERRVSQVPNLLACMSMLKCSMW
jgi:hypothetical protein